MPVVKNIQQRFVHGELDPQMLARVDIDQYYGAAEKMENAWPLVQGGFKRRPGLEYLAKHLGQLSRVASPTITAPNGGTTSTANDNDTGTRLLTTTNMSTTDGYVIVQYDLGSSLSVEVVDVVEGLVVGGSVERDDFYVEHSTDGSTWIEAGNKTFESTDARTQRYRVNATARYVRLVKKGSFDYSVYKFRLSEFTVWTNNGLSEAAIAEFNFNVDQHYALVLSDQNIAVYENGELQVDVPAPYLTSSRLQTINYTQGGDTMILVHEDMPPQKLVRGGASDLWTLEDVTFNFIPKYDYVPTSSTPGANITPSAKEGEVTITASAGVFTSSHVNQYIEGNGGRARILQFNSSTEVVAVTEIPFFDTTAINNPDWELLEGFEDVWSVSRGWPISVAFYEGRMWFGGSKSRPQSIWGSRSGSFFDFDPNTLLADDGIDYTIAETSNQINNLYPGRNLIVFTAGEEYIVPQTLDEPITPTTMSARRQTAVGSEPGLRPQEFEGGVFYVQRRGQSVQEFLFTDLENAYANNYTSLLSSHLVDSPTDFALRKSTSTSEGSYLLLVNGDGNLTVALILRSQSITAFAPTVTNGTFKAVGIDLDEIYTVVEREIDGTTVRYVERFNDELFMDAGSIVTSGLPTDTFSNLEHLDGESVRIKADGAVMADATIASGSTTIARDAATEFQCGLNFNPTVKDLPIENAQMGSILGDKKRVSEVVLQLKDTAGLRVNGKSVPFKGFGPAAGGSPLDMNPILFTGTKKMYGFRGWDTTGQVTIDQVDPLPMQVLALIKRVRF